MGGGNSVMNGRRLAALLAVMAAPATMMAACSAGGDSATGASTTAGTASGNPSSGNGGQGGTSGASMNTGGTLLSTGGGFGFDAGMGDGALEDGNICEEVEAEAEILQLDVVLVLDRSGSMETANLWTPFTQAITDFITDSGSAGLSIGMNFFPENSVDSCPTGYGACLETLYGYGNGGALQVPLELLPAGEASLLSQLTAQSAEGDCTPTYGALRGSLDFAMQHQEANPLKKVIVVLASDGAPNGCPSIPIDGNDPDEIASLAANAFNYNGVRTFTVAIAGSNTTDLDKIALAGGTTAAFDITNDITAFLDKMKEIQGNVLKCDFLIPDAEGVTFDKTQVNVAYTPGDGSMPKTYPQVASPSDCGTEDGWYYDVPSDPTKISLCSASCDEVQADDMAEVKVAFGCPTVLK